MCESLLTNDTKGIVLRYACELVHYVALCLHNLYITLFY